MEVKGKGCRVQGRVCRYFLEVGVLRCCADIVSLWGLIRCSGRGVKLTSGDLSPT